MLSRTVPTSVPKCSLVERSYRVPMDTSEQGVCVREQGVCVREQGVCVREQGVCVGALNP